MSVGKYINRNKIAGLILIVVIIIAFGFGGFGGGFLSNNQNNIVKINKKNVTTQDLISYIKQTGISEKAIQDNLSKNIVEELLSSLISKILLDLEIKDFNIRISENSLSKKIISNENFIDEKGVFQRLKYEKFLLENNISAPIFEKRLRDRELQKKLFDFIGAGSISPEFLIKKLYENENRKLEINYINLENFYKTKNEINDQNLLEFIKENSDTLKIEYIDFKYSLINPQNLVGVNEFNQEFFNKIDEIENSLLNGISFETIISKFNLNAEKIKDYRYSSDSDDFKKKIFELKNNKFDIFENDENYVIFKIEKIQEKSPNINDEQIKDEILELVIQKNKFDFNRDLLKKIQDKKFTKKNFLSLGEGKIQSLTLNSIKDNKIFEINSVKTLYSQPVNSFTLINDENNMIYLATIKKYIDAKMDENTDIYKLSVGKENTNMRNSILKSYDFFLNDKYNVDINQLAINNVKNLFQ